MDSLENFIRDHRSEFDTAPPPLHVWADVERSLEHRPIKKIRKLRTTLRSIAAAVLLLVIGGLGGSYLTSSGEQPVEVIALSDVSAEHAEMEQYFQRELQSGKAQFAAYKWQDPEVLQDLDHMEEVYQELQRELALSPAASDEDIVQAMIDNYRARLAILEHVLERMEATQYTPNTQNSIPNDVSI